MKHISKRSTFESKLPDNIQYTYVTNIGNSVIARARLSDGTPVYVDQKYAPVYFLPTDEGQGDSVGFDGTALASHMCDNLKDGKQFLEENKDAFGDIQPEYMFLSDTYGTKDVAFDVDRLYILNFDLEVDRDEERGFAPVEDPFMPITAITLKWRHMGLTGIVSYGTKEYVPKENETYVHCKSEEELLKTFVADWRGGGDYPDIITGWNIQQFDIPYLFNRLTALFGKKFAETLSPFERSRETSQIFYGQERLNIQIKGIAILDYYELYRKFTYAQQESYRLDHIAHVELKKRKVSYAEVRSLNRLYRENHQKFMEYNVVDVTLVDELDAKLKLIELVCALAYGAKCNFEDTFKQVRLWDIMIYHKLRGMDMQIPPRKQERKTEQYAGAYVKEPQVGLHKWVVSFDVASMYPHIIREWNLSPEKIVRHGLPKIDMPRAKRFGEPQERWDDLVDALLEDKVDLSSLVSADLCMAANAVFTKRDGEGFLPNMLKTLYDERVKFKKMATAAKKEMEACTDPERKKQLFKDIAAFNNQQLVRKVNLNSAYGALGSNYFRFYDTDIAEAVTISGQFIIRRIANDVNAYLNKILDTNKDYIIASDTDSVYVNLGPVVEKFIKTTDTAKTVTAIDSFCEKKIQPLLGKSFDRMAKDLNVYIPCLTMGREVIADKGVWTAKKRYILNCHNIEGVDYNPPKLKIMGIEAVKSSTPALCREWIKHSLTLLMQGTQQEVWDYIKECRVKFFGAPFEDVSSPRGCKGLAKYADAEKGIPIHVKGALTFNRHLVKTQLTHLYEPIHEGEKIKFAYLKIPNVFFSHVLSAPQGCPPEWNIDKWLDYDKQFEGTFIDPLETILQCAGWTTKFEASLFD